MLSIFSEAANQLPMLTSFIRPVFCVFVAILWAVPGLAQDSSDATLHVVRPIIRAEQDAPELCLEFDHALAVEHHNRSTATVHLTSNGKAVPVSANIEDITGNQLCVATLEHRKNYHLSVSDVHGAKGEKLSNPYSLSFTIPARHPDLTFVSTGDEQGLLRSTQINPVLRVLNVEDIKIELFRVSDPMRMAEAWRQRRQILLAPSEAATFARTNGTLVWQGHQALNAPPDSIADQSLSLDDKVGGLPSGLYLVVASAPDLRAKATDLAPIAATWVLRSNMRAYAVQGDRGLHVVAETFDATAPVKNVRFSLLNAEQKPDVYATSDDFGVGYMENRGERHTSADLILAQTDAGDIDFIDVASSEKKSIVLAAVQASISQDKQFYLPGEMATLTLTSQDIHNHPIGFDKGELHVLSGDHSLYTNVAVAASTDGLTHISFPAPLKDDLWSLVWQQGNGTAVAETTMRVSRNPAAPLIDMTADRALLSRDGSVNVTIKSHDLSGKTEAYVAAKMAATWNPASNVFTAWKDYHFGVDAKTVTATPTETLVPFITDANGQAHVKFNLSLPEDDAQLYAVTLRIRPDTASGALATQDLVLPLRPQNNIVGIKPAVSDGHFAENSLAQFDIVVLNHDGNPEHVDDLTYRIFEVGRNFEWFQADGTWQYKPQQQQRLVISDTLVLSPKGFAHVEWPVAAGSYRLDIANSNDDVLASLNFGSGWNDAGGASMSEPLRLKVLSASQGRQDFKTFHTNKQQIFFALDQPSMVTVVVADDHVRKFMHISMPKGQNVIDIEPAADWGSRFVVNVFAHSADTTSDHVSATSGELTVSAAASAKVPPHTLPSNKFISLANAISMDDNANYALRDVAETIVLPKKMWDMPADKTKDNLSERLLFISSEPLYNFSSVLSAVLKDAPLTTRDVCDWIRVMRLWQDTIVGSRLTSETALNAKRADMLTLLVLRQKADGSFDTHADDKSSLVTTAEALLELNANITPALQPVIDRAADWLNHQLDNTWFDEGERADRAEAYDALTQVGKINPSGLHYFSDQSADKNLSPLAALHLASAFAKMGDKDKAQFWLNAAAVTKKSLDVQPDLLSSLSSHTAVDAADLVPAMEKLSDIIKQKSTSLHTQIMFLETLWNLQNRSAAWHVSVGGRDQTSQNIGVISIPTKSMPVTFHNLGNNTVYVATVDVIKNSQQKSSVTRHIYRPDGGEVKGNLKAGDVYVVVLESTQPIKAKSTYVVLDESGLSLLPVSCALQGASRDASLVWLPPLAAVDSCEVAGQTILARLSFDADVLGWRAAYLVEAVGSALPIPVVAKNPFSSSRK